MGASDHQMTRPRADTQMPVHGTPLWALMTIWVSVSLTPSILRNESMNSWSSVMPTNNATTSRSYSPVTLYTATTRLWFTTWSTTLSSLSVTVLRCMYAFTVFSMS